MPPTVTRMRSRRERWSPARATSFEPNSSRACSRGPPKLGLECNIIEHPHLLTTQVGFTVTGPKRRIDEFVQGLNAEGRATVRAETGVMLSPL